MKFATRRNGTRDGELLVVSRDGKTAAVATEVAPTMRALLDDWDARIGAAEALYTQLNKEQQKSFFSGQ